MKNRLLIFIFLSLGFFGFAQSNPESWDAYYYTSNSLNSFKQLPAVHQKIAGSTFNYRLMDAAIFFRTNEERIRYNLPEFNFSIALEKAAIGHSIDMAQNNFFSHQSPIPGKSRMTDRLRQVGIDFSACAENIFNSYDDDLTYWLMASKLVEGWMNSSGHRANILNPTYRYLGCGAWPFRNPQSPTYYRFMSTQNFSDRDAQ